MDDRIMAVQRMQEYIEAHLDEDLSLEQLAQAAMYSPWYAYRLFRAHTGLTVSDYIRKLRLSRSAQRLKRGDAHVADAACALGFGSADGFTRAFRREFGCNPAQYARQPVPIGLFIPYGVKYRYTRKEPINMENVQSVFVQLVHKPARRIICMRGAKAEDYWDYCAEVGCDVWGVLTSMDSLCGEPVCLWLPEAYRKPGTSVYVQGVEAPTNYSGDIPAGFDAFDLPEADYLQFQGEPFAEENYREGIAAVERAMEKYNPAAIGYAWDDANPRIQLEPKGERGYIELRPVRKL